LCLLAMVILVAVGMGTRKAHAAACLTVDVHPGAVVRIYDGDTFDVFTLGVPASQPIRVQGVDTPERKTKEPGWEAARDFTRTWLARGVFRLDTCGVRSFERIVAKVTRDGEDLGDALRAAGLTKKGSTP
jgi:endonuclease YncB( thermonuclease family)